MPHIYAVTNVPPEILAYGMAKYSRSNRSLEDNLRELSDDQAAKFLQTFYFDYGHASIADLAHVAVAIEDISILAAMDIVDEPLWDGQERSTRYQNFDGSAYYRPEDVPADYDLATHELFDLYRRVQEQSLAILTDEYPNPPAMLEKTYRRTIRARAFDIARYCLPLNTLTSLGQITSARVLEQQIRRLMASPLPEIREIAQQLKDGITERPAVDISAPDQSHPVLPTLVKHSEADSYRVSLRNIFEPLAKKVPSLPSTDVELTIDAPITESQIAQLLYAHGQASYHSCLVYAQDMSNAEKDELLSVALAERGKHDAWPRYLRQAPLQFDLVVDVGAFRDFNRHRRVQKIAQHLNPEMLFAVPEPLIRSRSEDEYKAILTQHYRCLSALPDPQLASYVLPLAHRRRFLMSMDLPEAAYIIELRSRSQGHFSYRHIVWKMYEAIQSRLPEFARHIRVTPPEDFNPFQR